MSTLMQHKPCLPWLANVYLVTLFVSQLLSYRFVQLGGILTTASVFVIPITYSVADLISEQYGYAVIRAIIWRSLGALFLGELLLFCTQWLPYAPEHQHYFEAYNTVFHPILRIYCSNLIGIILGMFLNAYLLVQWKHRLNGRLFFLRSLGSSLLGELIFTALVITLVQWGVSSNAHILEMIAISFSVKIGFTFFSAWISAFIKPLLTRIDSGDFFEKSTSYNPLMLS